MRRYQQLKEEEEEEEEEVVSVVSVVDPEQKKQRPTQQQQQQRTRTMAADAIPPQTRRHRHTPWQRHHGFQRPLHISQLLRTVTLLFTAQLAMIVLLFMIISFLDPAHSAVTRRQLQDKTAQLHHLHDASATAAEAGVATSEDDVFLDRPSPSRRIKCTLCRVFVSTGTRHCSTCNKCIAGFDHHCVYLNTCIGSRNYPLFIGLLSCTILLITTQMIVTGFAISSLAHSSHNTARIALLCCLSLLPFLQLVCMFVLASFHVFLSFKGVRTHECLQQWYRSRANSNGTAGARHQQQEKRRAVVGAHSLSSATDRGSGDASSTDLESSGALEEEACEQVDTSHACEPMSILIGPDDHFVEPEEPVEREKYLV